MSIRTDFYAAGVKKYEGAPCRVCSSTTRFTVNNTCCACNARKRNDHQKSTGWPEKRKYTDKVRDGVYEAYGGKCCVCGICDRDILTIDHVNQDGAADRKLTGHSGHRLYARIRREGYPPTYRIMCFNHNIKAYRDHIRTLMNV